VPMANLPCLNSWYFAAFALLKGRLLIDPEHASRRTRGLAAPMSAQ